MWRLSLLFLLFPSPLSLHVENQIIFWNVGQGQWITAIDQSHCYHFDVGGEFINAEKLSLHCQNKENIVFYSHWDWDHIGLTRTLQRAVKNLCVSISPLGNAKKYKKALVKKLTTCQKTFSEVQRLNFRYPRTKADNDLSQIFIYNKKLLIPGDSTKRMEKIWSKQVHKINWLSVSHHGSRTSTSEFFLRSTKIHQAIVSARKRVYGHPHKEVIERLKTFSIPTLLTEDWGNIKILDR